MMAFASSTTMEYCMKHHDEIITLAYWNLDENESRFDGFRSLIEKLLKHRYPHAPLPNWGRNAVDATEWLIENYLDWKQSRQSLDAVSLGSEVPVGVSEASASTCLLELKKLGIKIVNLGQQPLEDLCTCSACKAFRSAR
jgi:hypothetical protein